MNSLTYLGILRRQVWQIRNVGFRAFFRKVSRRIWHFPRDHKPSSGVQRVIEVAYGHCRDDLLRLRESEKWYTSKLKEAFQKGDHVSYFKYGQGRGHVRDEQARVLGFDPDAVRLIGSSFLGPLGHTALLDLMVKGRELGLMPYRKIVLLVDEARLSNQSLVRLWRNHFELELITNRDWRNLEALFGPLMETADFIRTSVGYSESMSLWDRVNRMWEAQGNSPLLALPEDLSERARNTLEEIGLPRDAKFVALHVREDYEPHRPLGRNAFIGSYLKGISEIVKRGFFVVRMGDRTMTPLPHMNMVIDYAHSIKKADWIDVYLWSSCQFFVGTGSGPGHVPGVFGRPVLLTNVSAPGLIFPYSSKSLMIPKNFRDLSTGKPLPVGEVLSRGAGWNWSNDFREHGVHMIDNSPEQIQNAVIDMFEAIGKSQLQTSTEQLQFDEARRNAGSGISNPCAPSFFHLQAGNTS